MRLNTRAARRGGGVLILAGVTLAAAPAGLAPAAAAAGRPAPVAARPDAVPAGFKATALTWISPRRGWSLGTVPCGRRRGRPRRRATCSDVITTVSGGATWRQAGRIGVPVARPGPPGRAGITEIRFAGPYIGWAFGPSLLRTGDGGVTWHRLTIPGGGKQVLALAANRYGAYAVVSGCRYEGGLCRNRPLSLWHVRRTGTRWRRIALRLPANYAADVAVYGRAVFVVDPLAALVGGRDAFYISGSGRRFTARPVPCDTAQDVGLLQVVPTSATDVALLCVGNPGFSKAQKLVYLSRDSGRTYRYAGRPGLFGIQSQLAVSPTGRLAVASWSDGSFIYINDGHKTGWKMVVGAGDGGAGWDDISYVSAQVAWVVYGPTAQYSDYGRLYVTRDGGRRWHRARL
jgi:hypothetical protein